MKIKEIYKTKEKIMNNSLTEEQVKVLNMSQSVINEVRKVIIGKDEIIIKVLLSILAGGHILIEDIPGVGKTTMALAFAETLTDEIPVFHFLCMKNPSAAHKMRQRIDLWEAVKQ